MNSYFFVDGSALLGDVRRARVALALAPTALLNLQRFAAFFCSEEFHEFHSGAYRRFVFYFVQDDERLRSLVHLPNFTRPGEISDLRVEYCGKRVRQQEQARAWLDEHHAPDYVRECLYRSEKAVDTQICCDALQLAATGKLDRLFSTQMTSISFPSVERCVGSARTSISFACVKRVSTLNSRVSVMPFT